jgi:hypothetical protein
MSDLTLNGVLQATSGIMRALLYGCKYCDAMIAAALNFEAFNRTGISNK